jgi:tRNA nucleotidyltransferase (CCA-adding enzyme)
MMGLAFATDFVTFVEARGIQATVPAVLKLNPEQSKHLETTKIKVFDMEIDVVNLRSEEYAEVSRIPTGVVSLAYYYQRSVLAACSLITKKYGTPLEDAQRRDLTINALFYNVHTRSIEDHTGRVCDIFLS